MISSGNGPWREEKCRGHQLKCVSCGFVAHSTIISVARDIYWGRKLPNHYN